VLIVADRDPSSGFAQCALWRDGIDRSWVRAPAEGMERARLTHPRLVVVDLDRQAR
jgi:DNA-binding response OmpR family regulator